MSLSRPFSALILPLLLLLGCNTASPFKILRGGSNEGSELSSNVDAEATENEEIQSAFANSAENTDSTATDFSSQPLSQQPNSPETYSRRLNDSSSQLAISGPAEANSPSNEATPPTIETAEMPEDSSANPIQLTSSSRSPFDAFRFALPGSGRAKQEALAKEIADFQRFDFAFRLPTVAGETVDSHQFSGQLMVIDIWATWCAPCKRAIPDFVAIQDEFQSHGVQVIGITCDSTDPEQAAETARKAYAIGQQMNVNYPLLVDDGSTTKQVPGFRGYPTTLFMTPDGVVRYKVTGAQSQEKLAMMINTILQR